MCCIIWRYGVNTTTFFDMQDASAPVRSANTLSELQASKHTTWEVGSLRAPNKQVAMEAYDLEIKASTFFPEAVEALSNPLRRRSMSQLRETAYEEIGRQADGLFMHCQNS
jgi:hypothetical protein